MTAPVEPDVVVRTALQLLPIPPHGDEFWGRLEASLDVEVPVPLPLEPRPSIQVAAPAAAEGPAPIELVRDTTLAVVPPAFRRASNAVLLVVAAAAVVVVAIAGSALLDERRGGTGVSSGGSDAALETLMRDARDDATVTTLAARHERSSTEAVLAWVGDLGEGDAGAAWSAMGEASRAHFASESEFQRMVPAMAEGFGAWAAAEPDDILVTPVQSTDDGTIAVVTLLGTVQQEGAANLRSDAFPVRIVKGKVVLEPFASAGDLEVVIPEPADGEAGGDDPGYDPGYDPVGLDEELVFVLPTSAEAPVLRIDGGDTVVCGEAPGTDFHDLEGAVGQRCSYLPEGGFGPGEHVVTVAFVGGDGASVTASSIRFEAA